MMRRQIEKKNPHIGRDALKKEDMGPVGSICVDTHVRLGSVGQAMAPVILCMSSGARSGMDNVSC